MANESTTKATANAEKPPADDKAGKTVTQPKPEKADGEVVVSAKVVEGLFEEKRAAVQKAETQMAEKKADEKKAEKEAEKKAGEKPTVKQDNPGKANPPAKADSKAKPPETGSKGTPQNADGKPKVAGKGKQEKPSKDVKEAPPATENTGKAETTPEAPPQPKEMPRANETETIVIIPHDQLFPFKNHPFKVRFDDEMKSLVESVGERGVDQPALIRPREGGGYEIVAGHRRSEACKIAGYDGVPSIVRNMTDEEAVLTMTETNFNQRAEILPSERAKALKMQLDAIKRQGARFVGVASGDVGKRSNEIIAERNKMSVKTIQRYIALNNLVPDLMKLVDEKKIPFTAAVELSYIKPKNQEYISVAIDAQQSAPSLAQSQRMRELDKTNVLNGDVIDGIMLEEKKEENRVIINSQELSQYFGPDKNPREMKETILKLLDEYKQKQPLDLSKSDKKIDKAM